MLLRVLHSPWIGSGLCQHGWKTSPPLPGRRLLGTLAQRPKPRPGERGATGRGQPGWQRWGARLCKPPPLKLASSCVRGGSDGTWGQMSFLGERSGIGAGQWGSPHPWGGSKPVWMWHLGTGFGRHGGVGVMVGLDDLRGLSHPE